MMLSSDFIVRYDYSYKSVAPGLKNKMDDLRATVPTGLKGCNLWRT